MSQISHFRSYPLTRNLETMASYPLSRNLEPFGDWSSLIGSGLGLAGSLFGGSKSGGGGGSTSVQEIITPPAQPAPPVPVNWTPVIVSGAVVLIVLTLIMTTSKR